MTTLTADDLTAIGGVVKGVVEPMIDALAQDTAAGFAEVHGQINLLHADISILKTNVSVLNIDTADLKQKMIRVENTTDRIERVQSAEVSRLDTQELQIKKIRKVLRAA